MITITLNTPLVSDTGEMISSAVVFLENYSAQETIEELSGTASIQMYRTIENAIDRFRPIWIVEIPEVLRNIRTTLTAGQYTNVDLDTVQTQIAAVLEDGDSHGQWKVGWGTWGGLKDLDVLNTAVSEMPAIPNAAPTTLVATKFDHQQIDLTWAETSANEFGFVIERSLETGANFMEVARVGYNVTSHSDSSIVNSVEANTEYFYRVAGWNNAGQSTYSNEDSATTDPAP